MFPLLECRFGGTLFVTIYKYSYDPNFDENTGALKDTRDNANAHLPMTEDNLAKRISRWEWQSSQNLISTIPNGFFTNGLTEERQYEIIFEFTKMAGDVNAFLSIVFGPSIF